MAYTVLACFTSLVLMIRQIWLDQPLVFNMLRGNLIENIPDDLAKGSYNFEVHLVFIDLRLSINPAFPTFHAIDMKLKYKPIWVL